jgi:hypothetical protein
MVRKRPRFLTNSRCERCAIKSGLAPPAPERPRARKPRALRKITAAQRRRIEEAVERMIEALDEIDAPAEDLEPSLGSSETHPSPGAYDQRCE